MTLRLPILLLVAAGGCASQLNVGGPCAPFETGEDPCRQQLYFPSGIATDPGADVLYVSSANADLRYSGGAVHAIDLARFECAVAWARGAGLAPGCDAIRVKIRGADGKAVPYALTDPDPGNPARTVIEVDAAACAFDRIDPGVLECDEARFIPAAVKIGNFAGAIRVQSSPHRLWLPVRGDPSITYVDVALDEESATLRSHEARLGCVDKANPDPARRLDSCNAQRITTRDFPRGSACRTDAECPAGVACRDGQCKKVPLPPEPFGLYLQEGPGFARLLVAHLLGGEVTLIDAAVPQPASTEEITPAAQVVLDVRGGFFAGDATGRRGAFALAPVSPADPRSFWYLTSRLSSSIAMFRVADADQLLPVAGFTLANGPYLTGEDVRDVAVQPDGRRAFFVENRPPSMFTVDARPPAGSASGLPSNQVVDIVNVCQGPSHLDVRQWTEAGAPGAGDRTVTRVYVVCFATGQVSIVDPDLAVVADTVLVGRGPNDIAFNFGHGTPEPPHRRAYVANYTDATVSVIDLDRGSRLENRVFARIGLSSPPVNR